MQAGSLVRRSYGEVVGREEAPWWKCKRRVRDVWFPKLKGKSFKGCGAVGSKGLSLSTPTGPPHPESPGMSRITGKA